MQLCEAGRNRENLPMTKEGISEWWVFSKLKGYFNKKVLLGEVICAHTESTECKVQDLSRP
jgi:hypothetical protein